MPAALTIRREIEAALADRIPSAFFPAPRTIRPAAATGIQSVDELLDGGIPLGAISEVVGPDCSGRTSFALSLIAGMTQTAKVCAWVDVSNGLDPESAAAAGVDMARLLWVRCGVDPTKAGTVPQSSFVLPPKYLVPPPVKKGLHGGGFGSHPRLETKGMPDAVTGLLRGNVAAPPPQHQKSFSQPESDKVLPGNKRQTKQKAKPWARIEQALRATDLLLQAGGFSAIVLDLGGITGEYVSRIPLATWFRYRAAAERSQASIVLLTQISCAKSSAELLLQLQRGKARRDKATLFTGVDYRIEVVRRRFTHSCTKVIPLRKPPQRATTADWHSRTTWAGVR